MDHILCNEIVCNKYYFNRINGTYHNTRLNIKQQWKWLWMYYVFTVIFACHVMSFKYFRVLEADGNSLKQRHLARMSQSILEWEQSNCALFLYGCQRYSIDLVLLFLFLIFPSFFLVYIYTLRNYANGIFAFMSPAW